MRNGFFDKLLKRLDQLGAEELESIVTRLVHERRFFENVFEALEEGVFILSPQGEITFANQAVCDLFALNHEKTLGHRLEELMPGIEWATLRKSETLSRDLEIFYPENRFLNFYLTPIPGEDSKEQPPSGYVMLVRDITESKRHAEQTLESEKLNALTLLAAGVAHEIGNPLNSLGIHLQLIERELAKLPPQSKEKLNSHLATAKGEITRLDNLLKEFLHAIRPTKPTLKPADLNLIIRNTLKTIEPELTGRNIKVTLNLESNLGLIPLDPSQLKQALFNILKNASQAIPASGGNILITTRKTEYEIIAQIQDDGTGISPDLMGNIFDPYKTGKKGGTGLGLLIIRRIIREHGGEIEIQSTEGKGTNVSLVLPREKKQARLLEPRKQIIEI